MDIKIRIRVGEVEIDYEGEASFIDQHLTSLLTTATELMLKQGTNARKPGESDRGGGAPANKGGELQGTTSDFASKLKADSGGELALAAAAHLTLSRGMDTFPRKELLDEMKSATGHYKRSYGSNLSQYIKSLMSEGKFREPSKGQYALSASTASQLRSQIGGT